MIALILYTLSLSQMGDLYFDNGNLDLAEVYYEASIRVEGEDPGVMLRLGQVDYLLEKYQEAEQALSQLRSKEARRWLGYTYFQMHKYSDAVRILKAVTGEPVPNYYYAITLYKIGDYQTSLEVFDRLERFRPEEVKFWKALIFARMDEKKRAIELLDVTNKTGWWREPAQYLDSYLRNQLNLPFIYYEGDRIRLLRARKQFHSGNINRAVRIIDSISDYKEYRSIGLSICYLKLNWFDKAIKELHSLPDTGWFKKYRLHLLGEIYLNLSDYDAALKNFQLLGREGLDGLVLTFYQSGRYDSVVDYIPKIKRDYPESYDDYERFLLARSLFNLKRYQETKKVCQEIIESDPETNFAQQAYILIGEAELENNHPDSARMVWKDFVSSYPASPLAGLAMKRIGDSYYRLKEYSKAIDAYNQIENLPHTPSIIEDASLKTGVAKYRLGHYKSYISALKTFIRNFPDSPRTPTICLEIGDLYLKGRRLTRALRWFEETKERHPLVKLKALQRIAKIQEMTDDIDGLKMTYIAIIETSNNPYDIQRLAQIYLTSENYDSAIHWFEKLSHIEGFADIAYFEIARINRKIDRIKEAEFFLRPLIEQDSPYRSKAILELAEILRETGRFGEAKRILMKIGDNPASHLILGEIEVLSGNYLVAKREFIRACSLFGDDRNACAEALIMAGDAAVKSRDKNGAIKLYERAERMALDPRIKIRAQKRKDKLR